MNIFTQFPLSLVGEERGEGLLHKFANGLDYLVSILPNTKETRKIVDADLLSALPPHCVFINVGRGNAVDESALVDALEKTNSLARCWTCSSRSRCRRNIHSGRRRICR
jgi:phosphoglycerate dehydrogenase-like enzyme